MQDFAAIDFETANNYRSSVCSVGIVIVRNGVIVDEYHSLIQPTPNYYTYFTTAVHGMTRRDTDGQPLFPEVWAEVEKRIAGLPLVAHNKRFDEGCLKAVFSHYNMPYPNYTFHCSLTEARRHLRLPRYNLDKVAAACGFSLKNHHHALADAQACSHIWFYLTEGKELQTK